MTQSVANWGDTHLDWNWMILVVEAFNPPTYLLASAYHPKIVWLHYMVLDVLFVRAT